LLEMSTTPVNIRDPHWICSAWGGS